MPTAKRWPRGSDDQFLLGPIIPNGEEYLAIGMRKNTILLIVYFIVSIFFTKGTIPFSDATAGAFVKNYTMPVGGKKKDKKGTSGFSSESQQRTFGVTAQAFTKCRRHGRDDAKVEDPLRPGKLVPWSYVDPTSDYSFRFLTWARFAGRCFFSTAVELIFESCRKATCP